MLIYDEVYLMTAHPTPPRLYTITLLSSLNAPREARDQQTRLEDSLRDKDGLSVARGRIESGLAICTSCGSCDIKVREGLETIGSLGTGKRRKIRQRSLLPSEARRGTISEIMVSTTNDVVVTFEEDQEALERLANAEKGKWDNSVVSH